ncbi:MAG: PD-(D/E)XK nuclease family protein [candidate division Zixibacteria bacterium]|nr:PD-(D/E)XK nuclease family protein [candidate division Zixibacteria bacterium]
MKTIIKQPTNSVATGSTTHRVSASTAISNNFFDYAPRELTHSSFWAWVLVHSNMPNTDEYKLANSFLNHVGIINEVVKAVKREVSVPMTKGKGKNRFDIVVFFESGNCLIIENKIKAGLNSNQLSRYENVNNINVPNDGNYTIKYRVFLNSGYDLGYTTNINKHLKLAKWTTVSVDDIWNMINTISGTSQLLNDYSDWLQARFDEWDRIIDDLTSPNNALFTESIKHPVGQYEIAKKALGQFNGFITHGNHNGGKSYVNFLFYGINDGKWEKWQSTSPREYRAILLYTFECNKVTLVQYLHKSNLEYPPEWLDTLNEKQRMKNKLITHFKNIVNNFKFDLGTPPNRGDFKSTIGIFKLENAKHLQNLYSHLPDFHNEFLKALQGDNWPKKYFCKSKSV